MRFSPAFTLLEVLIGILILALALLGLGAVIPVVIRTQKIATDAAQGVSVANGAQAYLVIRSDLNRLQPPGATGNTQRMGWGVWLLEQDWSPEPPPFGPGPPEDSYLWEEWHPSDADDGMLDPVTGDLTLSRPAGPPVIIGVGDRLWPARNSDGVAPQFVWDFIGRRVNAGQGQPDRLQIALFVRRIDPNVRVAPGRTLFQVLTGVLPGGVLLPAGHADRRLAVAADPTTGLPTLTGVGKYAAPLVVDVEDFNPLKRDRLVLKPAGGGTTQHDLDMARQIGQKWVDNLGDVYTVVGLDEADASGNTVLIDPQVPAWVPVGSPFGSAADENTLREVAFTPQVPAYVTVFTLTPMDPK